jgi:CPA1 family monovalent cation:H+ antiporter
VHGLPLIALLIGSLGLTALARRLGFSPPLVLVLAGLALSFVPGMPDYRLQPDLILLVVLPPLLYSAALDSSVLSIKANLPAITSLAVGLVLATALAVGLVAHLLLPELPLAAAFALGAVVAPPDAVAAVAVGRRLGLPRRVMTVLGGESLVNDATALTAYRVAVAAAVGAGMSVAHGVAVFLLAAGGGVAVGLAVGWCVHRVRLLLADPLMESAVGLVVPFGAYLVAEQLSASGVLAVVVAGLYLGHRAPQGGFATRLQDDAVWRAADTVLEALVFGLIGLQLPVLVSAVPGSVPRLLLDGVLLAAAAIVVRPLWVFPMSYVRGALFPAARRRGRAERSGQADRPSRPGRPGRPGRGARVPWRYPAVISWAGMRGVVSIAAAVALPLDFPDRDVVIFLAFVVTVATLLVQGLTLPYVIRLLGIRDTEAHTDLLAEAQAAHTAAQAALARLDELVAAAPTDAGADSGGGAGSTGESGGPVGGPGPPEHIERIAQRLRGWVEHRSLGAWERLGRGADEIGEPPSAAFRRLRREMLAAERAAFIRFRDDRRIDDEVLRRVLHELDLEEALLSRE